MWVRKHLETHQLLAASVKHICSSCSAIYCLRKKEIKKGRKEEKRKSGYTWLQNTLAYK